MSLRLDLITGTSGETSGCRFQLDPRVLRRCQRAGISQALAMAAPSIAPCMSGPERAGPEQRGGRVCLPGLDPLPPPPPSERAGQQEWTFSQLLLSSGNLLLLLFILRPFHTPVPPPLCTFQPSAERLAVFQAPSWEPLPPPFGNVRLSLGRSLSGFKVRRRSRGPSHPGADESSGLR